MWVGVLHNNCVKYSLRSTKKYMRVQGTDITSVLCLVCFCYRKKIMTSFSSCNSFFLDRHCRRHSCRPAKKSSNSFVNFIGMDALDSMISSDFFADWLTTVVVDFVLAPIHSEKIHGMDPNVLCSSPPFWFISIPKTQKHHSDGCFVRLLENMAICKPTLRLRPLHTLSKTCNEQNFPPQVS